VPTRATAATVTRKAQADPLASGSIGCIWRTIRICSTQAGGGAVITSIGRISPGAVARHLLYG
jgi:hypothetical protein